MPPRSSVSASPLRMSTSLTRSPAQAPSSTGCSLPKTANGNHIIRSGDLRRKYYSELYANELVLLAYYIAAIKIEAGMAERGGFPPGSFEPFPGITFGDTFLATAGGAQLPGMADNTARQSRQGGVPITIIAANPPWSAGQKSSGDDNPNIDYPHIEQRVRDTYGKHHRKVTGRAAGHASGNLYVESFRWASDRLDIPHSDRPRRGVIAMVHPNSLSTAPSLIGMRAALRDEFSDIYVVNLLGDAAKSGDEYRREGDKIFGQGSRNGVQITVAVRNPDKDLSRPAVLHYATVPEYSTLDKKFAWLAQLGDATSDQFEVVPVNDNHDWINLTDGSFEDLMPVCVVGRSEQGRQTAVGDHALGAITNCDTYVYSFGYADLVSRINKLIDTYDSALARVQSVPVESRQATIDQVTENTPQSLRSIKWTHTLKKSLRNGEVIEFDESRIRDVQYRPFTKLWLYEDHRILSQAKATSDRFPRPGSAISGGGGGGGRKPSAWHRPTTEQSSERSRPTASSTTALSERTSQHGSSHGSDHDLGRIEHDLPSSGNGHDARHRRSQGFPTDPDNAALEAILVSSPSTRTTFAVLAVSALPDVHALDPAGRAVPRWS